MEHLARIAEQRHIETGAYFPSILGVEQDRIFIVETIAGEAPQCAVTAKCCLHIKRDNLIVIMEAQLRYSAQSDDSFLIEERDVLLSSGNETIKRKWIEVLGKIAPVKGCCIRSAVRVARKVS